MNECTLCLSPGSLLLQEWLSGYCWAVDHWCVLCMCGFCMFEVQNFLPRFFASLHVLSVSDNMMWLICGSVGPSQLRAMAGVSSEHGRPYLNVAGMMLIHFRPTWVTLLYLLKSQQLCHIVFRRIFVSLYIGSGATGRALDLRSTGCGFKSYSEQSCVSTLVRLFTPMCLCHQAV